MELTDPLFLDLDDKPIEHGSTVMRDLAERIRDAGENAGVYIVATGAGAGLQDRLWQVPGIGAALIGAEFPYAKEATDAFLSYAPSSYCSEETAVALATEAYVRGRALDLRAGRKRGTVALGLAASVTSRKAHRGDHRIHAACLSGRGCQVATIVLAKDESPEPHGRILDGSVANALGVNLIFRMLYPDSTLIPTRFDWYDIAKLADLFWQRPFFGPNGEREKEHPSTGEEGWERTALLPGTFNPLHDGHLKMRKLIGDVVFLLNADSVHKPALDVLDLLDRAAMFRAVRQPVLFTRGQPLFVDKMREFVGTPFVIGADTLDRLLDPKWGPSTEAVVQAMEQCGAKFFVFGRDGLDLFAVLDKYDLSHQTVWRLFQAFGEVSSVSSTALRVRG